MPFTKQIFSQRPLIAIPMLIVLAFCMLVLNERFLKGVSVDLTEDGLYSLSDSTLELVERLDDPVVLTLYYSRSQAGDYPNLMAYAARVENMLETLAAKSPDTVTFKKVNPSPLSAAEDDAVAAGLNGVRLDNGDQLWFGLKINNMTDGEAVLPFFTMERERFLEYDLAKAIVSLDRDDLPKLTLLTGLPMQTGTAPLTGPQAEPVPWFIYQQLNSFFRVTEITEDFTIIPEGTDVLFIAHPPTLEALQYHAIDQFVLKGGHAIVAVDPHAEAVITGGMAASQPTTSNMTGLLESWGVSMTSGKVIGDAENAQRVGSPSGSVEDYILWLALGEDRISRTDMVAGSVQSLNLASAGALTSTGGAATVMEPVVTSSKASMLFDASRAVGLPNTNQLLIDLTPDGFEHVIAARLTGKARTGWPNYAAMGAPTGDVSEGDINVFVIADTDFMDDRFWVSIQNVMGQRLPSPFAGNGAFLLNMLDHMVGTDELIALRTRGIGQRPFEEVAKLRRQAEAKYRDREEALLTQISELEARLATIQMQRNSDTSAALTNSAEAAEVDTFTDELLLARKELRLVKLDLRQNIDALGQRLALWNTIAVPWLLLLILLGRYLFVRTRKRRII